MTYILLPFCETLHYIPDCPIPWAPYTLFIFLLFHKGEKLAKSGASWINFKKFGKEINQTKITKSKD